MSRDTIQNTSCLNTIQ